VRPVAAARPQRGFGRGEDSLREAADLDDAVPGAGTLFLEASTTAALALGAWEDLEEYGIADPDDVIRRTFRQRWLASAERRHDWACYTAAVATLASPNCDGPLDVIEPPETVVGFLLNGQEIDVLHIPSPGWR
jgi:hypothetical protein